MTRTKRQKASLTPSAAAVAGRAISGGFATNFAHPGGNITGFTVDDSAFGGKCVQSLKEIAQSSGWDGGGG
jgi:putative ABC transport system substrate-binding protein